MGRLSAFGLIGLLALAACGVGTGEGVPWVSEDGGVLDSFEDIQLQVFDVSCAVGSGCHAGGSAAQGLSLEAGLAIPSLVDVASTEVPDLLRVAPGQPDDSYLVIKIRPDDDPRRVGVQMPRVGRKLNTFQITAIERWIAAGATEDWEDDDPIDPVVTDDDDSGDDDDSAGDDDDSAWDDDDSAWDDDDSGDAQ